MIDPLVDPAEAKEHLRLDGQLSEVTLKVNQATGIVMDFMNLEEWSDDWIIPDTSPAEYEVPAKIQGVTLGITSILWHSREDSAEQILNMLTVLWDKRTPSMA